MIFDSHLTEFIVLSSTGVGWGMVSLFQIFSKKLSLLVRALGIAGLVGFCGSIPYYLTENLQILLGTIGLISLLAIPSYLLSIPFVRARLQRLLVRLNRPLFRQLSVGLVGILLVVVSALRYEQADEAWLESQDAWVAETGSRPLTTPVETKSIVTDRGRTILVAQPREMRDRQTISQLEANIMKTRPDQFAIIRRDEASDLSNCHGWAFTEGKYWIGAESVQEILDDNGYQEVKTPQPGDLAIFREGDLITHTSIVRYVTEGQPVIVEGKWGWMGVFLHIVDQGAYGKNFTYYRSPRAGHLLAGTNLPSPNTTYTSVPTVPDNGANLSSSNGGN